MVAITDNEKRVLRAILTNCFHDGTQGEDKITNPVWSNCINDADEPSGLEGKSLSGVCGSLAQKGMIGTNDECIWLTKAGYDAATAQSHQED